MNYTFIILGVILLIVLYVLYKMVMKPTSVLSTQTYLQTGVPSIQLSSLTSPTTLNYSYVLWIYVNNINQNPINSNTNNNVNKLIANNANNIFSVSDGTSKTYLSLDLDSNAGLNTSILLPNTNTPQNYQVTPNFALQRWEYVIISINQQQMDLYLDGKLIKSANLGSNPATIPSTASIYFGNGDIYISKFQRLTQTMDPQTAWSNYLAGSGAKSTLSNYGLSMVFSKDNTPQKTFNIF